MGESRQPVHVRRARRLRRLIRVSTPWIVGTCALTSGAFAFWISLVFTATGAETKAIATAHVTSCTRDPLRLWLTFSCHIDRDFGTEPHEAISSTHRLHGVIDVEMRVDTTGGRRWRKHFVMVPAGTRHENGLGFTLSVLALSTVAALSGWTTSRLLRLLEVALGGPKGFNSSTTIEKTDARE